MHYRHWNSIEVSYNTRTLSGVVEACDNANAKKNKRFSVVLPRRYGPRNYILLMSHRD